MNHLRSLHSQDFVSLGGRLLTSAIFIASGLNKLREPEHTAQYMKSKNLPAVPVLSKAAAGVEILGGLGLLLGYRPRTAASLLFAFMIPTTAIFHDFWAEEGEGRQMQQINFMKNLAILGGLLQMIGHGAGGIAVHSTSLPRARPSEILQAS